MRALPLLLLLGAGHPRPKDDCALSPNDLAPALSPRDAKVEKTGRSLAQTLPLKGGMTVRYEVGGCSHFNFSFSFRGFPPPKKDNAAGWIKLAYSLLEGLPLNPKGVESVRILLGALGAALAAKAPLKDGVMVLPCGDAQCQLSVQDPKVLAVSYSFAI